MSTWPLLFFLSGSAAPDVPLPSASDPPSERSEPSPDDEPVPSDSPEPAPPDEPAPSEITEAEPPEPEVPAATEPTPRPAPSSSETAESPKAESPEPAPVSDDSPLLPSGESDRMSERPIGRATWKPMSGVRLRTADDRFALTLRLRVQFRYELERDHETMETRNVFQIRRARIQLKGHVFGEHNKYYLQLAVAPRDMDWTEEGPTFTPIRNWEISFDYLRDLTLTVGQMKKPFNRQRVISSGDLQMVDRSNVTAEFNIDRDVGMMLSSEDLGGWGYLRYRLGVYNGEGRDGYTLEDMGLSYVGRLELHPTRDADEDWDYDEVDWDRKLRPKLAVGLGYAYNDRAQHARGSLGPEFIDGGTVDFHHAEADVMLKVAGLSLTSEVQFREGRRNFGDVTVVDDTGMEVPAPRVPPRDGLGYYVQAGFLIPRQPLELTARWGQIIGLGGPQRTSLSDTEEIGGGFNWYIARHSLKVQTDYFRTRSDAYDSAAVAFHSVPWRDGADLFRIQLQLAF